MSAKQSHTPPVSSAVLSLWLIGDLHYRALPAWNKLHTQRLAPMFEDLHALWQEEGPPAFCVSPGDIVETCALANYERAKADLAVQLEDIPFYPGMGNHEYEGVDGEVPERMGDTFTTVWQKPLRYTWTTSGVTCIMLDYPNPYTLVDPLQVFISQETLSFLDAALVEYAANPALIFLHCPLRNSVLDRDPERRRDYSSTEHFFSPENSQAIYNILARHRNACLYFSGHTHTGWEAPNIVCTEQLGAHPVTFVNLMSPWYTGAHTGPRMSVDLSTVRYIPDDPDVIPTFSVRIYQDQAVIRVREHRTRQWLKQWTVPLS